MDDAVLVELCCFLLRYVRFASLRQYGMAGYSYPPKGFVFASFPKPAFGAIPLASRPCMISMRTAVRRFRVRKLSTQPSWKVPVKKEKVEKRPAP